MTSKYFQRTSLVLGVAAAITASKVSAELEEVIVTAQKRDQSVLDVPVTMDVISAEFIERTNTMELDDLSRVLPNVVIQEQGVSLPSFNIRGITDDDPSLASTPRISVYQDGFDISKKTVSSVALFDVNRVEVLKGPQPTLFGVAAANGAISIINNLPSDERAVSLQTGWNSEDGVELEGMLNTPINDNHSFRVAALYREMDGVVDNQACQSNSHNPSGTITDHKGRSRSCTTDDGLNGVSVQAIRTTLLSSFDQLEVISRFSYEYNDQPGIAFKSGSIAPKGGDTDPYSDAELGMGSLLGTERDLAAFDVTVNYDINDMFTLTTDAYYKDVKVSEGFDADGTGLRLQDAYFDNNAELSGASTRLVFTLNDRFEGFVGASVTHDESSASYYIMVDPFVRGTFNAVLENLQAAFPGIPLTQNFSTSASEAEIEALRAQLVGSLFNADGTPISNPAYPATVVQGPLDFESELDIRSVVAEGSYDITDALNLTFGIRYIDETRYSRNFKVYKAERDFDATLPRFALNYELNDDWRVYFNYAEGRRSPVVNPGPEGLSVTKAETVDSYDIGIKYEGEKLSFNAAVFTYEYQDYQETYADPATLQNQTVTVGDSTMSGAELMLAYAPTDTLYIMSSIGILDAEFADDTADGSAFQFGGNEFRLAPELSGAFNISKKLTVQDWNVDLDLLLTYQSEVFFESSNYPGLSQDSYWLADTSIKFSNPNSSFSYEIYADNVFDEEYLIDAGNTGGGFGIPTFVRGMPRIAGVRMYVDF